jgi:hypothetical protein
MAHEDVAKQFTEQELQEAKQKWWCNSFHWQELQEEAEVWGWDDMVGNKSQWARWAKCLQMAGVTVVLGTEKDSGEKEAGWG